MGEKTDEEIVLTVQTGDIESFGILVERYEAKLKRYAKKFLSNREDAEDLVQNVFIKAYTNIKGFNTSQKFSSWIYRIAHNEFINAMKRKKFDPLHFFDSDTLFPHPIAEESADDRVNNFELKESINKCLDKLEPKYLEPLILFYFEYMSYKDISDILKIPVSTVGVRIGRGKKLLQKYYKQLDPTYE
ncbi:hypothetical protein COW81_01045 [Candidatus Campbellbacteria bacterium CG22_combo_CG10-13_8_21_14_all_36_13]|uniref:RNA polymerase sigma factor n=1 Tax=Candidatus Campbellbacteria bacterium CG22_combo_CG10-13_8_21_14_all_36_13 TaxID=1974529 RepID=A0A2H0DZI3_9BACT|nr:MAG: hypothetical protein COW81_01045 [Candidatus Campbellbacteria bacterium CG22_combo_CG10-13_8_21_14_all_36_13]